MADTNPSTEAVEDVIDGFGLFSRWYGFDEALNKKGSHTSSTPTEAKQQALFQLNRIIAQKCKEAKRKQMQRLNAVVISADTKEDALNRTIRFITAELNGSGREK